MKKTILSALALVALASCSKSDEISLPQTDVEVRISSSIATRTTGNYWEKNDAIGVYMTTNGGATKFDLGNNVQYTNSAEDSATAAFSSTTPLYFPSSGNVDLLAYYPYSTSTVTAGDLTTLKYPMSVATQTDQGAIDLMSVSLTNQEKSAGAVAMTFQHKLSRIALTITNGGGVLADDLKNLVVTLSGTATTADFDLMAAASEVSNTGNIQDIVMLTTSSGLSSEAIIIPQSPPSDVTLTFETRNAANTLTVNKYTAKITTSTFAVGQEYSYTATINNSGVTISSQTISSWNADDDNSDDMLSADIVTN